VADLSALSIGIGLVGGIGGTLLTQASAWRQRKVKVPKLELAAVDGLPIATVASHPAAYARLEVTNDPKSDGANEVVVRIERVEGAPDDRAHFLGASWQLAWANEDRGNPNVPPTPKSVGPGNPRTIDLAHLNRKVPGKIIVDIRPQPGDNKLNRLGEGRYVFHLVVGGENAPARRYAVELVHDGVPWDGERTTAMERLKITGVRRI
jgi:hypothetical protein